MADTLIAADQQGAFEVALQPGAEKHVNVEFAGPFPYNGWATVPLTVINHSADVFVYARIGAKHVTVANPMSTLVPPNSSITFQPGEVLTNPLIVHLVCADAAVVSVTR